MTTFADRYAVWRNRPFPAGSADDSVDELHADLALVDSWVAESVVPFVERGLYRPAGVDVIGELWRLRARATELAGTRGQDDATLAGSYTSYLDLLIDLYDDFLRQPTGTTD
jgi:hypothetical protein